MARRGLNEAFEKAAKAAEKRLEAETKKQEKQLEKVGKKLAGEATKLIEAALKSAIQNVDALADQFRLESEEERANLRRALEATQRGISGAKAAAGLAALAPPQYKIPLLIVAGVLGGAEGFGLEDARKEAIKLRHQAEREQVALRRTLESFDREVERVRAARRRTGRLG